jgi:uncharacterized glyoxalase superfamily protein PhnB
MGARINILLTVSDIDKSIDYYQNKLNLKRNTELKDGQKIRYIDFVSGPNVLMLVPQEYKDSSSDATKGIGVEIYIDLENDVKEFYEILRGRGVTFSKELYITPWNTYQFHVKDPDGYIIIYSQEVPEKEVE